MISIIIPTYDRAPLLDLTLASLARQSAEKQSYEIVVVDDGSSDNTREVVASYEGRLRIAYLFQEHVGFRVAKARNMGATVARGDVLVFIDSGIVVGRNFVAAHLERWLRGSGDEVAIGYVYAFNNYKDFATLPQVICFREPDEALARLAGDPYYADVREENYRRVEDDLGRLPLPWCLFWTTNVAVPRAAFRRVGGFDEAFVNWGMEDVDLGFRLFEAGCRMTLTRAGWGIHYPHERDNAANFRSNDKNKEHFLRKHPGVAQELYLLSTGLALNENHQCFIERLRSGQRAPVWAELSGQFRARVRDVVGDGLIVGPGAASFAADCSQALCLEYDATQTEEAHSPPNVKRSLGLRLAAPDGQYSACLQLNVERFLWADYLATLYKELDRVARARFAICRKATFRGAHGEIIVDGPEHMLIRV